jgi:hypothetical protein
MQNDLVPTLAFFGALLGGAVLRQRVWVGRAVGGVAGGLVGWWAGQPHLCLGMVVADRKSPLARDIRRVVRGVDPAHPVLRDFARLHPDAARLEAEFVTLPGAAQQQPQQQQQQQQQQEQQQQQPSSRTSSHMPLSRPSALQSLSRVRTAVSSHLAARSAQQQGQQQPDPFRSPEQLVELDTSAPELSLPPLEDGSESWQPAPARESRQAASPWLSQLQQQLQQQRRGGGDARQQPPVARQRPSAAGRDELPPLDDASASRGPAQAPVAKRVNKYGDEVFD